MKFYFYCPCCEKEEIVEQLPKNTLANIRDGYGFPIYHYECQNCGNLDAGFIPLRNNKIGYEDMLYYQHVIGLYQNVRGFKK